CSRHRRRAASLCPTPSLAGMVGAFSVTREVRLVEIDRPQIPRCIALGLVVEMGRVRMAALAAGGDRPGAQPRAEFDDGDEAVAAGAVPAPRARPGPRREGGQ